MHFGVQGYLYVFRMVFKNEQTFLTKLSLIYVHSELHKKKNNNISLWAHYNFLIALHGK